MTDHPLNKFLSASKAGIKTKFIDLVVMGNQAADLDSMASAIAFAFARARTAAGTQNVIAPFIPIARADFKLRTEAVCVFETAGINPDHLIFTDDLPLPAAMDRVKALALVDHNQLSPDVDNHRGKVAMILDHHKDQGRYPDAAPRIIEPVGSCATLAGEILIRDCPDQIDDSLAQLLAGTILLDTVNLDPAVGRVTPKDRSVAAQLLIKCPMPQNDYFSAIQTAKFNTDSLNTFDLLNKDYKEFKLGQLRCGIASVLLSLSQWEKKDRDLRKAFDAFARHKELDILISMNAHTDPEFKREIAVYSTNEQQHAPLVEFLKKKGLALSPISLSDSNIPLKGKLSFHVQGNTRISRKKLTPMLDKYYNV